MLSDVGSRDQEFEQVITDIKQRLLKVAQVNDDYVAVLMQGSGTFGVESVIGSVVPDGETLFIIDNGAYGKRLLQIANALRIKTQVIKFAEKEPLDLNLIEIQLKESSAKYVAMVHCETSTGVFNPIEKVAALSKEQNKRFIVDAMSSFGAVPIDMKNIDYLVSSANKCIEGVPGFSFIIAKKSEISSIEGQARSLSLDLYAQYKALENNGQFRFTPPTHAFLAFHQALIELELEGGVSGRKKRYQKNHQVIADGMAKMGFKEYLPRERQGYIITSFEYSKDKKFCFQTFYQKLNDKGLVIYPGKVGDADCFRIGNIGRLFEQDMNMLLSAIKDVKNEMGFE